MSGAQSRRPATAMELAVTPPRTLLLVQYLTVSHPMR
jgi:hypothetical protein